jgi:hypothetical protein
LFCIYPLDVTICPKGGSPGVIRDVNDFDVEPYLMLRAIQSPITTRQVLAVAAYVLHTETDEGLAIGIAKQMIGSLKKMALPFFGV